MATTLVTGAAGFVGSHLMAEMQRRGLSVRGVTRGVVPGLVTIPDAGSNLDWRPLLDDVDTVVHLAARVHVMHETESDPLQAFREVNVRATLNLARQAARKGVRRFVFVSSVKVNGERTDPGRPFTSADRPDPQDPYGVSKAEAEAKLFALGQKTGMEIVVVRPPLVYGPGVGGNFRSLMKWAASGVPSPFASVGNRRSLVHVANLCDLIIRAGTHPRAANRVFLASDGHDLSTHELLTALSRVLGKRVIGIPVPPSLLWIAGTLAGKRNMASRLLDNLQVDITDTVKLLEWKPPLPVMQALATLKQER